MFAVLISKAFSKRQVEQAWARAIIDGRLLPATHTQGSGYCVSEFYPRAVNSDDGPALGVRPGKLFLFDGTIDYRDELGRSLGIERTHDTSDLELFVAAYEKWGKGCVEYLYGDYALAVWDEQTTTLWAATDHCAAVKLYYARTGAGIVLSTHQPCVSFTPDVDTILDDSAIGHLVVGFMPRDQGLTPHRAIRFIPPGHVLTWKPGQTPVETSWFEDPESLLEQREIRPGEVEDFIDTFRSAVATQLSRNAGTAAMVSGGLDSTLVAGHAAKLLHERGQRMPAFTSVPNPQLQLPVMPSWSWHASDWPYAVKLAQHHRSIDLEPVPSGREFLGDLFARVTQRTGVLLRNGENHAWLMEIAERARSSGCDVVLTGQRGNTGVSRSCPSQRFLTLLRQSRVDWAAVQIAFGIWSRTGLGIFRVLGYAQEFRRAPADHVENDFIGAAGLKAPDLVADVGESLNHLIRLRTRNPLAGVRQNYAFLADPWPYAGVRFKDPTGDRRVVAALARLPAIAYFWRGLGRGIARRTGAGVVPESIRRRWSRGAQCPDAPFFSELFRERYLAEWQRVRRSGWLEQHFDMEFLDRKFSRFMNLQADRLDTTILHRILAVTEFLHHHDTRIVGHIPSDIPRNPRFDSQTVVENFRAPIPHSVRL